MSYTDGFKEYNDAVKHRKHGEVTIYNFDSELYHNIPEWMSSHSRYDEAEAGSSANIY